jgi:hypothetical protein
MVIIAALITNDDAGGRECVGLPGVLRQACLLL